MRLIVSALALATAASGLEVIEQRQTNWTVGQTVQTSSGPVTGHPAKNQSTVSEYLGITFGKAERFSAPVAFNSTEPINGTSFGFSCPVAPGAPATITPENIANANLTVAAPQILELLSNSGPYSEDCLNLNVWTKPQVGESKKAVLVWIYGGGFSSGSAAVDGYNGANIAEQEDVVLVSFNYRLSILGFPGMPNGTQNLGLLDQRLAVEWVRDNIENFGGDPSRITIFGQSAGSASVDFYSYAWTKDPIVAGLIEESGTVFSWGMPSTAEAAAIAWFNVTSSIGCGDNTTDSAKVLSCMREANYTKVLGAVTTTEGPNGILSTFQPTIDNTVVFANYSTIEPAKIPLLSGSNDYEGGLFETEFALAGVIFPKLFWQGFNLQEFTCPAGIRANVSVAAKTPIWRYRYLGLFPDSIISSEGGTYHAAELPLLFNTVISNPPPTAAEISIGNYMRGAWATFAKDPAKGLLTYGNSSGWPSYDPSSSTLIRIGFDNITGTNLVEPVVYDALCPLLDVHSTNLTKGLEDLSLFGSTTSSTPSPTSSSGSGPTGSTTGSGSSPTNTKTGAGSRLEASVWLVLATAVLAWVL